MRFPTKQLLAWFSRHRRDLPWRRRRGLYATWIAEVMLQQTQAATATAYYERFLKRFPTLRDLAAADLQEVLKAWEGLGYYARARNLHRAARQVRAEHGGVIPRSPEGFGRLPGVGAYICAAVLSMASGVPLPVVDGNVLRLISRLTGSCDDISRPATRTKIEKILRDVIPHDQPGRFNEALMELGALVCLPRRPNCPACPLRRQCEALRLGLTASLPNKSRKPAVPFYDVALALLVRGGKLYVQCRPEKGHLGGLWEFPGGKARPEEEIASALRRECREELGIAVRIKKKLAEVDHAYTHFRVRLHLFAVSAPGQKLNPPLPHLWIHPADLSRLPFPRANHKLFLAIKAYMSAP